MASGPPVKFVADAVETRVIGGRFAGDAHLGGGTAMPGLLGVVTFFGSWLAAGVGFWTAMVLLGRRFELRCKREERLPEEHSLGPSVGAARERSR
jgi:hypothetical protein